MRALLISIVCMAAPAVWACAPDLPAAQGRKAQTVNGKKYVLAYRTQPDPVVIGQHFVVELAVCAKEGAAPESVRVDAHMPEHRHGMNYKTTVAPAGAGRYRVEGLMFHMPGRWEYIFEVRAAGTTERMTTSVVLQ